MNPPAQPPPIAPAPPGLGRVLVACLLPALILLCATLLGFRNARSSLLLTGAVCAAFLAPAWAAWDLHRRRRAIGKNVMPSPWLAAGAGLLGGIVFTLAITAVAVVVLILVLFGVCALNGGKLGG